MADVATAIEWDDETFERVLERVRTERTIEAAGARISSERLASLLSEALPGPRGDPVIRGADFSGAIFEGSVDFGKAKFSGDARFEEAKFSGVARFEEAKFSGDARFGRAQFSRNAWFDKAQFSGNAWFDNKVKFSGDTRFEETKFSRIANFGGPQFFGDASFAKAQFCSDASFINTPFSGKARFGKTKFSGVARFGGAEFCGYASFGEAQFFGDSRFGGTKFSDNAWFGNANFRRRVRLGPLVVAGNIHFDQTAFDEDVQLNVAAGGLSCRGTRFGGRADLNVRWAEAALDGATFVERSRLGGVGPFPHLDDSQAQIGRVDRGLGAQARPRVLSLRHANVENLALGSVDLRACRFYGAHGLDHADRGRLPVRRASVGMAIHAPPHLSRRAPLARGTHWSY